MSDIVALIDAREEAPKRPKTYKKRGMIALLKLFKYAAVLAATLSLMHVATASAADLSSIFGQWIERFPNGAGMVTEFTPDAMESYSVDPSGKRLKDIGKYSVTYKNLDSATIGVDFQGGGGVMVVVEGGDTLILDFPGMGVHTLKKLDAPAAR